MPSRMSDLIQLIATLSEMQSRRRQLDLTQQQLDEARSQFNRKMGFDEKSKDADSFLKVYAALSGASPSTKAAFGQGTMASRAGIHEENLPQFLAMVNGMPTSSQVQTERAVEQGLDSMAPEQRTRINQETAASRLGGMNLGQVAQGRIIEGLANRETAMLDSDDPTDVRNVAQAVTGMLPGWAQFQSAEYGRGDLAYKRATLNAKTEGAAGSLTADQMDTAIGQARLLIESMAKRGKDDWARYYEMDQYNKIADLTGMHRINSPDEAPMQRGLWDALFSSRKRPPSTLNEAPSAPAATRGEQPRFNFQYQSPTTGTTNPIDILYPNGRP